MLLHFYVLLVPSILASDIMRFDPTFLKNQQYVYAGTGKSLYQYNQINNRNLVLDNPDTIESEYGVFEEQVTRPPFLTSKNRSTKSTRRRFNNAESSKYQEQETFDGTSSKNSEINAILKNYLAKLYNEKYSGRAGYKPQQSKIFFDDGFWAWKNKTKSLTKKFLSLFTIVQFNNSQCQSTSSSGTYLGTCYHESQCSNLNGTAMGACAEGYGVCCVFRYSCGATSSNNCTYFESPGYPDYDPSTPGVLPPSSSTMPPATTQNPSPTPDPRSQYLYQIHYRRARQSTTSTSCSININKLSNNVQQMRLDFIDLELRGPTNGTCIMERLVISGQNVNSQVPAICGYNTGQHVYVDVSMLTGPLQLSVLSSTGERKRFKIRICQIATTCTNSNNCLQYYTGVTGTITSFNYDQAAMANRSIPGYFNNLNYAICIRKEAGYCSITYSNTPGGLQYPFELRNVDETGQSTVPPGQAGAEIFNCPNDYIVIAGTRLCGNKLNDGSIIQDFTMNAPVTDSSAGPIVILVRTNGAVTGRGFKLFYTQNRCAMT